MIPNRLVQANCDVLVCGFGKVVRIWAFMFVESTVIQEWTRVLGLCRYGETQETCGNAVMAV